MSKQEWFEHMTGLGLVTSGPRSDPRVIEALAHMRACDVCDARKRTRRANLAARERDDMRRCLSLKKTPYGWE